MPQAGIPLDQLFKGRETSQPDGGGVPLDKLFGGGSPAVGSPEFKQNLNRAALQNATYGMREADQAAQNPNPLRQAAQPGEDPRAAFGRQVQGYAVGVGQGIGNLFRPAESPAEMIPGSGLATIARRALVDPSIEQYQHGATKLGALPVMGPMAASMGSSIGSGDYGGAVMDAGQLAGMTAGLAEGGMAVGGKSLDAAVGSALEKRAAAQAAKVAKPPVEAWNHAIKPKGAVSTSGDLGLFGPYLKQREAQLGSVATNTAEPAGGLLDLTRDVLRGENNPSSIAAQTRQALAPFSQIQISGARVGGNLLNLVDKETESFAPHVAQSLRDKASVYLTGPYKNMTLGEAEQLVIKRNAQLKSLEESSPTEKAAILQKNGSIEELKAEVDAIRQEMYDKLTQLGVTDAALMKRVYGAGRSLEDGLERAQQRELVKPPRQHGPSTHTRDMALGGALAGLTHGDIAGVAAGGLTGAGVGAVWDWMANSRTPQAILHKAWTQYAPPEPIPFTTQGPMTGPMSRLLPAGPAQMPPANIMPGNTGTPMAAQPGASVTRQLPPGPPGQGRMTVLPPMGGAPAGGPSFGSGPFPEPRLGSGSVAHGAPIDLRALPVLEDLPHDQLTGALFKNLDHNRISALKDYLATEGKDFPRIKRSVDAILGNWKALKGMEH